MDAKPKLGKKRSVGWWVDERRQPTPLTQEQKDWVDLAIANHYATSVGYFSVPPDYLERDLDWWVFATERLSPTEGQDLVRLSEAIAGLPVSELRLQHYENILASIKQVSEIEAGVKELLPCIQAWGWNPALVYRSILFYLSTKERLPLSAAELQQMASILEVETMAPESLASLAWESPDFDIQDVLAEIEQHLERLRWSAAAEAEFIAQAFGGRQKAELKEDELIEYCLILGEIEG